MTPVVWAFGCGELSLGAAVWSLAEGLRDLHVGGEGLQQAWAWGGGEGGETHVPGKVLRPHPQP